MKPGLQITLLIMLLFISSACGVQQDANAEVAAKPTPPPVVPAVTATAPPEAIPAPDMSVADHAQEEDAALIWEGISLANSPQGDCVGLTLSVDGQARIGPCGAVDTPVEFLADQPGGWTEILARFAPFEQEIPDGRIVFRGQGQIGSPAWQRAISSWAEFTYAELASGRVSASGRTVMSWWLGELPDQPGLCRHLVVLTHGYTNANITPCAGGQVQDTVIGWIDPAAWDQFDAWLVDRAPVYQDNDYFSGEGTSAMSEADIAALADWAGQVYAGLRPASVSESGPDGSIPADGCLEAGLGTLVLENRGQGYCLLYPDEYEVVQTNDTSTELVIDSVMNHIDPRVSITVDDAAGRTAEQIANAELAAFSLPDWIIERTDITIDGEPAVVLDHLPGQDLNRRVFLVHEGRLYHLFFTPVDPSQPEVYQRMETFYRTIIDSFRFVPPQ